MTITVDDVPIRVLVKGARPSRSDLIVEIEERVLTKIFNMLSADLDECFQTAKRSYKRKVKAKAQPAHASSAEESAEQHSD